MRQLPYIRLFPNKYSIPTESLSKNPLDCTDVPIDTGFIDRLTNDVEYIPIPERIAESETFVELAIEYSTISETAIEVKQLPRAIAATYYFDFLLKKNPSKDMLADLIKMCDSVALYKPEDNEAGIQKLILTYNTHDHHIKN